MKPKSVLSLIAVLNCAAATLTFDASVASNNASSGMQPSEFSSAARKRPIAHTEPVLIRRRIGADPSFDEYGRLYRPPPHLAACAMDLGYGRWVSCNTGR